MRRNRFTESEIVGYWKEVESGGALRELSHRIGISETTIYRWRRRYGGLEVDQARRLKTLEEENERLKRAVVDQKLYIQVLKDVLGKGW